MRFRGCVATTFAVLSILLGITSSYAAPGIDIPLNNRSYRYLEKLASSGLIKSHLIGTRPVTGKEAARLLIEARERLGELRAEGKEPPPWALMMVEEMERELSPGNGGEGPRLEYFGRPNIKFIYLEGQRSSILGIKAAQNSLVYNNEGIEPEEGVNAYFSFDVDGGAGPLAFYLNPLFSVEDGNAKGVLHKGYIRSSLMGLDLDVGKMSLWWGQGYHGGLFLTNNTEPLKMIRLTNPHPASLPWVFKYLGPFRFDVFVSKLEKDRDVPEPYFTGLRFNFKPHPVLELGFTRTFIMGGSGRPGLNPKRLWDIMFGENGEGGEDLSNSIAGADLRLTLPFFQLYVERAGEDESQWLPTKRAYLVGFYLPFLGRGVDLRVEYANITNKVWYAYGLYSPGYTYKDRILGHHVGGGGRDAFVEIGIMKDNRLNGKVSLDYEERGITTQIVAEKHYQVATEWEYRTGKAMSRWSVDIALGYERIKNVDYTPGLDKDNALVSIGIKGMI